ncbi:MAG: hypothetical protein EB121_03320 [Alphaproteobacteria bacterium]|nr:hypothetical protein [Alphaproteobacteria bacterium]
MALRPSAVEAELLKTFQVLAPHLPLEELSLQAATIAADLAQRVPHAADDDVMCHVVSDGDVAVGQHNEVAIIDEAKQVRVSGTAQQIQDYLQHHAGPRAVLIILHEALQEVYQHLDDDDAPLTHNRITEIQKMAQQIHSAVAQAQLAANQSMEAGTALIQILKSIQQPLGQLLAALEALRQQKADAKKTDVASLESAHASGTVAGGAVRAHAASLGQAVAQGSAELGRMAANMASRSPAVAAQLIKISATLREPTQQLGKLAGVNGAVVAKAPVSTASATHVIKVGASLRLVASQSLKTGPSIPVRVEGLRVTPLGMKSALPLQTKAVAASAATPQGLGRAPVVLSLSAARQPVGTSVVTGNVVSLAGRAGAPVVSATLSAQSGSMSPRIVSLSATGGAASTSTVTRVAAAVAVSLSWGVSGVAAPAAAVAISPAASISASAGPGGAAATARVVASVAAAAPAQPSAASFSVVSPASTTVGQSATAAVASPVAAGGVTSFVAAQASSAVQHVSVTVAQVATTVQQAAQGAAQGVVQHTVNLTQAAHHGLHAVAENVHNGYVQLYQMAGTKVSQAMDAGREKIQEFSKAIKEVFDPCKGCDGTKGCCAAFKQAKTVLELFKTDEGSRFQQFGQSVRTHIQSTIQKLWKQEVGPTCRRCGTGPCLCGVDIKSAASAEVKAQGSFAAMRAAARQKQAGLQKG